MGRYETMKNIRSYVLLLGHSTNAVLQACWNALKNWTFWRPVSRIERARLDVPMTLYVNLKMKRHDMTLNKIYIKFITHSRRLYLSAGIGLFAIGNIFPISLLFIPIYYQLSHFNFVLRPSVKLSQLG